MTLHNIQSAFKDLLLDQPEALDTPPEILLNALQNNDIALPQRLKVYRNNVIGSLSDVMVTTFPTVQKLVGEVFFKSMAHSFIMQNPPTQGCLNTYGTGFDKFIRTYTPASALPYLPDVAHLDMAMNDAYYAPDDIALTADSLSGIAEDALFDLPLPLRESATLLRSEFPLRAIHEFCLKDRTEGETLDIHQGGDFLLVYRPHLKTEIIPLEEDVFFMLSRLNEGLSSGEALNLTINTYPAFNTESFLQEHIQRESFQRRN